MKKKNPMMRIAACMIVAVLLTTTGVAGTFAKYTTESKASDFARVAKWGVELQVVGNLYGEQYGDVTNEENLIVLSDNTHITVQRAQGSGADTSDVVAPGTKNEEGFTFKVNGVPEVDNTVTFMIAEQNIFLAANQYGLMIPIDDDVVTEANFPEIYNQLFTEASGVYTRCTASDWDSSETYYTLEDYVLVSANYYPVVYTLTGDANDGTSYSAGTDAAGYATDTLDNLSAELAAAAKGAALVTSGQGADVTASADGTYKIYKVSQYNESNEDLADKLALANEHITWEWKFERGATNPTYQGDQAEWQDKADTVLGNMIFYAKGGTIEGEIVYAAASAGQNEFTAVAYDTNSGSFTNGVGAGNEVSIAAYDFVKDASDNTIACLDTQFSIDIIVTQND